MVAYVAFVAILNLWLGYTLGVYIAASRRRHVRAVAAEPLPVKSHDQGSRPIENDAEPLSPEPAYEADYADVEALDDEQDEPGERIFSDDPKALSGIS